MDHYVNKSPNIPWNINYIYIFPQVDSQLKIIISQEHPHCMTERPLRFFLIAVKKDLFGIYYTGSLQLQRANVFCHFHVDHSSFDGPKDKATFEVMH